MSAIYLANLYHSDDEFNKLLREWKKYSKSENIDIYGNKKIDKDIVTNND